MVFAGVCVWTSGLVVGGLSGCGMEEPEEAAERPAELPEEVADRPADAEDGVVLEVAAAHDGQELQLWFRFETDEPSWYHDYLVYEGGQWVRHVGSADGEEGYGLYEDRISVIWSDGSVAGFAEAGGYVTVHPGMRTTATEASEEQVEAHPWLGEELGQSDVRKFIAESREEGASPDELWQGVRPAEELEQLREDGVFLDLWQWRAHRSNPVGYADNGYVLEYRHGSQGRSMYRSNESDAGEPRMMYDPEATGRYALDIEALHRREYGQDDDYYLAEDFAVPFDSEREWEEGDAIPRRLLQEPSGSRGAIRAAGTYKDGSWDVRLWRSLESPEPMDSLAIEPGRTYAVAFAVHQATGARFHDVSMPMTFGLDDAEAQINAIKVEGDLREVEADELEWVEVEMFHPGDPTGEFVE